MGWIASRWNNGKRQVVIYPYKTDLNMFKIVKVQQEYTCAGCDKRIPKKSYAYGGDWIRLCLDCGNSFSASAIKKFKEVIKYIQENDKEIKKNREKYDAENTLASL